MGKVELEYLMIRYINDSSHEAGNGVLHAGHISGVEWHASLWRGVKPVQR